MAKVIVGSIVFGFAMVVLFLASLILSYYVQRVLKWIDDNKSPIRHNWLLKKAVRPFGFLPNLDNGGDYHKGKKSTYDGFDVFWAPACTLMFGPFILTLSWFFYPVAIGLALLFAIAHLARFAVRAKKVMDKHIADPDAHKKR